MFKQFDTSGITGTFERPGLASPAVARSGQLDALVALEQIGSRRSFARDKEVYAEGEVSDGWYKVVSGTVRVSKLLADGRRYIAEFCFAGDCFGLDTAGERVFAGSCRRHDRHALSAPGHRATDRRKPVPGSLAPRRDAAGSRACAKSHAVAGTHDGARAGGEFFCSSWPSVAMLGASSTYRCRALTLPTISA